MLNIADKHNWQVVGSCERFSSFQHVEEQLLMLAFNIDGRLQSKTRTEFTFECKEAPFFGKVVFKPRAKAYLYIGDKLTTSKNLDLKGIRFLLRKEDGNEFRTYFKRRDENKIR